MSVAFERFEVQLGEIDAVPIEAGGKLLESEGDGLGAVGAGEVHELAPIEVGVLADGGLLAPLGMIVPEAFADVRQLDPGVDQDAVAVAGVDQVAQLGVALGVGLPVVPGGDVESGDAGVAPPGGEIIEIDAEAVGGIEEGPEVAGADGRREAHIDEGVREEGEAVVGARAGRGGEPEEAAGAGFETGEERGALPAFAGEDAGGGRDVEDGEIELLFPDDVETRLARVNHAADGDAFGGGDEAEGAGGRGVANEDDDDALGGPFLKGDGGFAALGKEDSGGVGGDADAGEELGPSEEEANE